MIFKDPLVHGILIKRYKRFLADVKLDDGSEVTAHCTNSGSMKSCLENGAEVYLTSVNDPKRRTKFTWEMIQINKNWVGVNTMNPNRFALEAMQKNEIVGLEGYTTLKREVTFEDSRFDIYAENSEEQCFVEIKNVTMKEGDFALFPDAVTTRGQKHLEALMRVKKKGMRAVMLYIIQRMDVDTFGTAEKIDPDYSKILRKASKNGVEIIPLQVKVTPKEIVPFRILPFNL